MRKFLTNSASLQRRIDEAEGVKQLEPATAPEEACEDDATYAKVSVNSQPPHALDSYDKVLGVAWDRKADHIVFDIAACFSAVQGFSLASLNLRAERANLCAVVKWPQATYSPEGRAL